MALFHGRHVPVRVRTPFAEVHGDPGSGRRNISRLQELSNCQCSDLFSTLAHHWPAIPPPQGLHGLLLPQTTIPIEVTNCRIFYKVHIVPAVVTGGPVVPSPVNKNDQVPGALQDLQECLSAPNKQQGCTVKQRSRSSASEKQTEAEQSPAQRTGS